MSRATAAVSPSCSFAVLEVCCPGVWRSGVSLSIWSLVVHLEFSCSSGVSLSRNFAVRLEFRCSRLSLSCSSLSVWSFAVPEFCSPSGVSLRSGVRRQEFHGPVVWRSGVSLSSSCALWSLVALQFRLLEFRRLEVSLSWSFAALEFRRLKFRCPGVLLSGVSPSEVFLSGVSLSEVSLSWSFTV